MIVSLALMPGPSEATVLIYMTFTPWHSIQEVDTLIKKEGNEKDVVVLAREMWFLLFAFDSFLQDND